MSRSNEGLALQLVSSLAQWPQLREEMAHYGQQHELPDDLIASLQLAAEEWFVNIVHHAYEQSSGEEQIYFYLGPASNRHIIKGQQQAIEMIFRDQGQPFNPLLHPDPDVTAPLEQREVGGLGIWLIKQTMDHCEYVRRQGWNEWTMSKLYGG